MKISDTIRQAIRNDRELNGMTLYQLVEKYEFSKSSIFEIIKHCDDSKVKAASPSRRATIKLSPAMERPKLSKADLGEATRQMISARLMLHGFTVYKPMTEDTPIDLLLLGANERIIKCQCKYIWPSKKADCHVMACVSIRKNGANRTAYKHIYTKNEVDFFMGYCLDNDSVYIIPFSEIQNRTMIHFWVLREPCRTKDTTAIFRNNFDLLNAPVAQLDRAGLS